MSNTPQSTPTRDECIQWFAQLSDETQAIALAWFDLVREAAGIQRDAAMEILRGEPLGEWTKAFLLELIPDAVHTKMIRTSHEALRRKHAETRARWEAKDNFDKAWSKRSRRSTWCCAEEEELAFFEPLLRQNPAKAPMIAAYVQILYDRLTRKGIALPSEPQSIGGTHRRVRPTFGERLVSELQVDESFLTQLEQLLKKNPTNEVTAQFVELAGQDIAMRKRQLEEFDEQRWQREPTKEGDEAPAHQDPGGG